MDERFSQINMAVKRKFIFVGSSIVVFPALIIVYMHYQAQVTFGDYVNTLFVLVFLIALIGLYILFNVFDNVFSAAESSIRELTERAAQSKVELMAIKDVANKAFENRSFEETLNTFLHAALKITNSQIGSSFVVDHDMKRLRLVGSRGLEGMEEGQYIDINDSLMKHVITEKRPLLVKDIESDPRTMKKNDPKYGSPSFLSIPILARHRGDVTAVVNLSCKESEGYFDVTDEELLSPMLIAIKLNLENELLRSQIAAYKKDTEGQIG